MSKKLFQKCGNCGLVEAKGSYCSRCISRTLPEWIFTKKPSNDALASYRAKRQAEKGNL